MTRQRKAFGTLGERFAKGHLRRLGYRILWAPYRCRIGEIDIIALQLDTIVFVEVKSRHTCKFGSGIEAVTIQKQRHIIRTAKHYLRWANRISFRTCRFDVISIHEIAGETDRKLTHIQDAFRDNSGV